MYNLRADPDEQTGREVVIDGLESQYRDHLNEISELEKATREGISSDRL